ncbi:MAG: phosphoesterase, partial [Halobacteriales archaeon]
RELLGLDNIEDIIGQIDEGAIDTTTEVTTSDTDDAIRSADEIIEEMDDELETDERDQEPEPETN